MPAPELFAPFVERLARTVRDDIADCAAASFGALSLDAAQKLLMFDSQADLLAFARDKVGCGSTHPTIYIFYVVSIDTLFLTFAALMEHAAWGHRLLGRSQVCRRAACVSPDR